MNSKHAKTLRAIFATPTRTVRFSDIETLLQALGFEKIEGDGSLVRFEAPGGSALVTHRPHPGNEAPKLLVRRVSVFLREQGIEP